MRGWWMRTVLAVVVLAVAAGCAPAPPPPAPPPPPPATPTKRPPPPPPTSRLTGLPADPEAPVLAVKIDNSAKGRPWDGVEAADVTYVEPVEGGLTRLLAVFSSRLPASVGPIRSARESDVDVLAAYGRPALAFSGAAPPVNDAVAGAPILPVVPERAPGLFRRNPDRAAPANVYADPRALLKAAGDPASPRDIGFRFGPAPRGGTPTARRDVRFPAARVGLTWDAGARRWSIAMDGRPVQFGPRRAPIQAATVIVQKVRTRPSAVRDAAGSASPTAVTVGRGRGEVLRDGRSYPITWARGDPRGPTRYTTPSGAEMPLAPGPIWVLLTPNG